MEDDIVLQEGAQGTADTPSERADPGLHFGVFKIAGTAGGAEIWWKKCGIFMVCGVQTLNPKP